MEIQLTITFPEASKQRESEKSMPVVSQAWPSFQIVKIADIK